MGIYQKHVMPRLVNLACGTGQMKKVRAQTVSEARGRVLEIGFGSGHNLPFYKANNIDHYWALEPDAHIRKLAQSRLADSAMPVDLLDLEAESIPLDDNSADTVVVTFTLCTIPGVEQAIGEMRRVLKPEGRLIFAEHGTAPDAAVARWQSRIEPVWKRLAGGCHLTRNPLEILENGGFMLEQVSADYMPKAPRFASYVSFGSARPQ